MKRRMALAGLGWPGCWGLAGCAGAFDYKQADAPEALSTVPLLRPRPNFALVLGPGGPRGYAHIGVMRVLEEAGIRPDLLVGSSVGALLAVFWASGLSAARVDALSMQGGPLTVFDPSPFADRGWIHGRRLQDYVNAGVGGQGLQALERRVIVVATRRDNKAPRFFIAGNAGVAVRASSAVPGIVSPVGISGTEYEDGDESLPLAVSAARAAGASFVMAVNVYPSLQNTPANAPAAMRERDARRRARIEPETAQADFVLQPELGYYASPLRSYFVESRRIGEAAMRAQLPLLRQRLATALGTASP